MSPTSTKKVARNALKRFAGEPITDDELQSIFKELSGESNDRAAAVIGATFVDRVLIDRLMFEFRPLLRADRNKLFTGDNAPLGTLSTKTKIAHAMDILSDKERDEIDCIRDIRNAFAHSMKPLSFEKSPVADLVVHLRLRPPERDGAPNLPSPTKRMAYIGSCIEILRRFAVDPEEYKKRIIARLLANKARYLP